MKSEQVLLNERTIIELREIQEYVEEQEALAEAAEIHYRESLNFTQEFDDESNV